MDKADNKPKQVIIDNYDKLAQTPKASKRKIERERNSKIIAPTPTSTVGPFKKRFKTTLS